MVEEEEDIEKASKKMWKLLVDFEIGNLFCSILITFQCLHRFISWHPQSSCSPWIPRKPNIHDMKHILHDSYLTIIFIQISTRFQRINLVSVWYICPRNPADPWSTWTQSYSCTLMWNLFKIFCTLIDHFHNELKPQWERILMNIIPKLELVCAIMIRAYMYIYIYECSITLSD